MYTVVVIKKKVSIWECGRSEYFFKSFTRLAPNLSLYYGHKYPTNSPELTCRPGTNDVTASNAIWCLR